MGRRTESILWRRQRAWMERTWASCRMIEIAVFILLLKITDLLEWNSILTKWCCQLTRETCEESHRQTIFFRFWLLCLLMMKRFVNVTRGNRCFLFFPTCCPTPCTQWGKILSTVKKPFINSWVLVWPNMDLPIRKFAAIPFNNRCANVVTEVPKGDSIPL